MNYITFRKLKQGEDPGSTVLVTAKDSSVYYFTEKPNGKIGLLLKISSGNYVAQGSIESVEEGLRQLRIIN
tara:strand:+ start:188 stop:400 length:213 start_codon:yes stop_codon:yes gene_type:complete